MPDQRHQRPERPAADEAPRRRRREADVATAGYEAARLAVLAKPFDPVVELPALARAEQRLGAWLGLDDLRASAAARRSVLLARERRLHETLVLEADADRLRSVIGDIAVDGEPGGLLLGLHYGPYSSLLPLVLARRLGRVSFLVDRRLDPSLVLPTERVHELERAGVLPPGALAAIDGGVRRVRDELARGSAVVVLADPYFLPPGSRSVGLRIGARELRVPRGAAWLSEQTACAVAAVSIVPTVTGHRVAVRGVADVSAALTVLAEQVVADPAPWEGWLREQRHL